jgi:hypothetical protein
MVTEAHRNAGLGASQDIYSKDRILMSFSMQTRSTAAIAIGALALGAVAVGALAIGYLAIGRLAIKRTRVGTLEIDELVIRRIERP